nr:unnamed protein product [Callosobruchus chinensis]
MLWHEHVSSIATAAGKKLGYLFRARKYFSPSNLLTLYKAQISPSLEYCSHIWEAAAPTTLSILDAVQRRAILLIDVSADPSNQDGTRVILVGMEAYIPHTTKTSKLGLVLSPGLYPAKLFGQRPNGQLHRIKLFDLHIANAK